MLKKKVYKVAQAPLLILQSEQPQDSRPALPAPSWQMSEEACLGSGEGGPGGGVGPQSMKSGQCREGSAPEPCPLEENDVFLAGFFLVEWCGGWGPGLEE